MFERLRGNSKPFGSTLILLAGDFRQTLPIIPRSTPADEMNACLKNCNLWAHVKTLKLTTNMRVRLQNDDSGQTQLQWRVTNMARNDLRARGGLGGVRSAPTD